MAAERSDFWSEARARTIILTDLLLASLAPLFAVSGYLRAIIGAEYVTGMVDVGTHSYGKFVRPKELKDLVEGGGGGMNMVGRGRMVVEGGIGGEVR